MAGDLFGFKPAITWNDAGNEGVTRDGRKAWLDISVLTGRFVMVLDLGHGLFARRSRRSPEEARREIEKAAEAMR